MILESATCSPSVIFPATWVTCRAFDLFEQKTQILRLLDISSQAGRGAHLHRRERARSCLLKSSRSSAPYEVDGKVVGTLGVIGPYAHACNDRMIQIVDITSKLVSNAPATASKPLQYGACPVV